MNELRARRAAEVAEVDKAPGDGVLVVVEKRYHQDVEKKTIVLGIYRWILC